MICKQMDIRKMLFSCCSNTCIWKNVALGIGSPRDLLAFAGVHQRCKQATGREEEEVVHGNTGQGRPFISVLKRLLPMLPGNWGSPNPPNGKAKPSGAEELPTALAHSPISSVVELRSRDSFSKIFLLPGNQAEERCTLVFFFPPSSPLFG